jgi:hypothetical protein
MFHGRCPGHPRFPQRASGLFVTAILLYPSEWVNLARLADFEINSVAYGCVAARLMRVTGGVSQARAGWYDHPQSEFHDPKRMAQCRDSVSTTRPN